MGRSDSRSEDYVFISYAHLNRDEAMRLSDAFKDKGYRFWIDKKIAEKDFTREIADHIYGCGVFVCLVTEEYCESENCLRELKYAVDENCFIISLYKGKIQKIKKNLTNQVNFLLAGCNGFEYSGKNDIASTISDMKNYRKFNDCKKDDADDYEWVIGLVIFIFVLLSASVMDGISLKSQVKKIDLNNDTTIQVGDLVAFGSYEQDDNSENGTESIEWVVLDKREDKLFLMSVYALEHGECNESDCVWEKCWERRWLNEQFYDTAFDENEKKMIIRSVNDTHVKATDGNEVECETIDKVFLLNSEQFAELLQSDYKYCGATDYAKKQNVWSSESTGKCVWHLRDNCFFFSADEDIDIISYHSGKVYSDNQTEFCGFVGLRPAIWIDLEENTNDNITISDSNNFKYANEGDILIFGSYEQDGDDQNGFESIEWKVVEKQEDEILVISNKALATVPYYEEYADVTWETSTLRRWMNEDFYLEAFNELEKELIVGKQNDSPANPLYDTNPGADTFDRVFLLSINEVEMYFSEDERQCEPTNAIRNKVKDYDDTEMCDWWLRSPGVNASEAAVIRFDGVISYKGFDVFDDYVGMRPAVCLRLVEESIE